MSYPRIAPNIEPYAFPQTASSAYQCQQQNSTSQSSQPVQHQSIYRPAYRRIPYTTSVPLQLSKSTLASMPPEPAPIIVPSQQCFYPYPAFNLSSQPDLDHVRVNSHLAAPHHWFDSYNVDRLQQLPVYPIFEETAMAPIAYEQQAFHKELVRDVFFSPAFMDVNIRRESSQSDWSSSSSSSSVQSDTGSKIMPSSVYSDNIHETPSDLLYGEYPHRSNDILFKFGLELGAESLLILNQKQGEEEEHCHFTHKTSNDKNKNKKKKKPSFGISALETINNRPGAHDLPTPPGVTYTSAANKFTQTKRRCSDSAVQEEHAHKKSRVKANSVDFTAFSASTFPDTPSSAWDCGFELNDCDYFATVNDNNFLTEEATKRLSVQQNRFGNAISGTAINSVDDSEELLADGAFSIASWDIEEHHGNSTALTPSEPFQPHTLQKQKEEVSHSSAGRPAIIQEDSDRHSNSVKVSPRPTTYPTIYQKLTKANIDWCRYCGTTEGVNWRPGPWGKRTLCNKHGCDYKGYGFACKLPRLNLTEFLKEKLNDRERPVLQLYCSKCQRKESWEGNILVRCEGCPKAYHQKCCSKPEDLTDEFVFSGEAWFCDEACCDNAQRKKIVVELPRKRLPLMSSPTSSNQASATMATLSVEVANATKSQISVCCSEE